MIQTFHKTNVIDFVHWLIWRRHRCWRHGMRVLATDANAWLVPCRSFASNTSFRSIARQFTSNQLTTNIRIHIFARHISTLDRSATRYKWIRIHAQSANIMHYLLTNIGKPLNKIAYVARSNRNRPNAKSHVKSHTGCPERDDDGHKWMTSKHIHIVIP